MRRTSLRIPGPRAHARARTGDPGSPGGLPAVRRAVRFRGVVPEVLARAVPHAGSTGGAQEARAARALRRVRWLTRLGVAAALGVGLATGYGLGWRGLLLLFAFFISSSLLSKRTTRNHRQVFANGGVAALAALVGSWVAFAGALAAATADTWASEIGRHARTPPRLITNGRPVPAGTDGGITVLGTVGGIAGAAFMAVLAVALGPRATGPGFAHPGWLAASVAVAGIMGMLLDSVFGATVQGAVRWFDNDAVNLAATVSGALIAAAESLL